MDNRIASFGDLSIGCWFRDRKSEYKLYVKVDASNAFEVTQREKKYFEGISCVIPVVVETKVY